MILAHTFSHLRNPNYYDDVASAVFKGWELINGVPDYESDQFKMHPAA